VINAEQKMVSNINRNLVVFHSAAPRVRFLGQFA